MPWRRPQAIILTYAGLLVIGPSETKFCAILIKTQNFSFTKMQYRLWNGRHFVQGQTELFITSNNAQQIANSVHYSVM